MGCEYVNKNLRAIDHHISTPYGHLSVTLRITSPSCEQLFYQHSYSQVIHLLIDIPC